jgi:hypothetical protein
MLNSVADADTNGRLFSSRKQGASMKRAFAACLTVLALASPALAQNEDALRAFFEGKSVGVKIDLPGTSDGVDVQADSSRAVDYQQYGNRLKANGVAIRAGEGATVTLVKVKKDLIEFQLNGGGFGTFSDDTSSSVYIAPVEKSKREKDLEKLVRDEQDSRKKRDLQRELDDLRDRRERENRRIDAERVQAEEAKKARIADERLRGGSRFNLRYSDKVPSGIRPEEVMAALSNFVDFSSLDPSASAPLPAPAAPVAADRVDSGVLPKKGMLRGDVEALFAAKPQVSERREGSVTVTTLVFERGDQRVSADFVGDVLVSYTITSKYIRTFQEQNI